ncbi:MFS transporter [Leucothrix sargassi]|nr:MFS transporter [Leucothrix sargassi]
MTNPSERLPLGLVLRIFIPFAAGYFLSYFYRVVNALIASDLTSDLGINASQLGLLTSAYLIAFAVAQLPLGVMLDRYGPRQTEAGLLLIAALGAAAFATADTASDLLLGRALIGFGVSACLMASIKAFVQWFPLERLPMVNGFLLTAGGLGALTAATPVELALQITDWRGVFWILSGLTLVAALAVFFIVPDKKIEHSGASLKQQIHGIKTVFGSLKFWAIAPWTIASQATAISLMGLWTGPWLRDVAAFDRADMTTALSAIAMGLIAGYLLTGVVTDWLRSKGITPMMICGTGMVISMLLLLAIIFEFTAYATALWVSYTFFASTAVLSYAILTQRFETTLAGRVNTAQNVLIFLIAFVMQWGIGFVINLFPSSRPDQYDPSGYQVAFSIVLSIQTIAMIWYFISLRRLARTS